MSGGVMRLRVGRWIASGVVVLAAAGFVSASVMGAGGRAGTCTAAQKAQRVAAAAAYARAMPAARRRYFSAHTGATLRKGFVARQRARLAVLRAAAACHVSSTATPATPGSPSVSYQFGPGVGPADEVAIRRYVGRAATDELALVGVPVTAIAYASTELNWLGQAECDSLGYHDSACYTAVGTQLASGFSVATGGPGGIWIDSAAQDFRSDSPALIQKILAHELFHVIQYQLDGLRDTTTPPGVVRPSGPVWLNEGAAELVGYRVTSDVGLADYAVSLAAQKAIARRLSTPLDELQTAAQAEMPQMDPLFEVAVDHLVAVAPNGLRSLVSYYEALRAGSRWQDAFAQAFGRTVDAYDAEFQAYRATL